ncbi:MAG: nonstructural protein [Microvirus sp.]|nr:MAG: nonstructural protein [Microvirus sp.]
MMHLVMAVRDSASECYMRPFVTTSKGLAMRSFGDEVVRPESDFHKHPHDFILFHLGAYDDVTGMLEALAAPEQVARAIDYLEVIQ